MQSTQRATPIKLYILICVYAFPLIWLSSFFFISVFISLYVYLASAYGDGVAQKVEEKDRIYNPNAARRSFDFDCFFDFIKSFSHFLFTHFVSYCIYFRCYFYY